jgi:pimeloyl-ACP methyl ester carboxylesterase
MKSMNFGRLDSGSYGNNRAAIVFVHGFTGDWKGTWGHIPTLLREDGRLDGWDLFGFGYQSKRRFDLLGLWSADAAIPEIATKLYTTLLTEVPPDRYKGVALVAHSMGGLVVQQALTQHADLRLRTTHVVLFGTPSAGLAKADKLSFVKQQIANMRENSDLVKKVRASWTALKLDSDPKLRFLTVAGELDQFVPPSSSLEPFPVATRRVVPGNHVTMLDVESANDLLVRLLIEGLTGGTALGGPRNSARVAAELGEFVAVVEQLWPNGRPMPVDLDDTGAVDLAMALEKVGRSGDAIDLLRAHKPQGTDPQGVLGGRLKRRWLVTRSEADYESALNFYREAFEHSTAEGLVNPDQAYYHGINVLYLELAHEPNYEAAMKRASSLAQEILEYCERAKDPRLRLWCLATEGDALIVLGKWEEGLDKHRQAIRLIEKPWQALSMEEHAIRLARLVGRSENELQKLADIYEGATKPEQAATTSF